MIVNRKQHNSGFTLVELLVVIAIIGVLVALLLPAVQAAREAARRVQCKNALHQLALAVLNYESAKGSLPIGAELPENANPATTTSSKANWVVSVLPFMEMQNLYDSFDLTQALSATANEGPRSTVLSAMMCPSDDKNLEPLMLGAGTRPRLWARGNYAANVGNGPTIRNWTNGIWGPKSQGWLNPFRRGMMGPNVSVELQEVTDGLTNVIMLAEIRAGLSERDYRGTWAMGTVGGSLVSWYGFNGDANGPNACYPNADDVSGCESSLQSLYQTECMSCFSGDQWNDQAAPRSLHPGGVHVAMGDGSVNWIDDTIETTGRFGQCCSPWDRLILSADGDGIPLPSQ